MRFVRQTDGSYATPASFTTKLVKNADGSFAASNKDNSAQLFDSVCDPIALIKMKELYELLETATDKAEDVANVLESVVLKGA